MKSNICKIEKGSLDLAAILTESEKVAVYNELNEKQTLQLRLLCEEIDGMLPNIIDGFCGDFWIEFENGECKINLSFEFEEYSIAKKKDLINLSKNKKNAAAKGLLGKIRSVLEDVFFEGAANRNCDIAGLFNYANEFCAGINYDYAWSFKQYKEVAKKEVEEWDELEKSIITSVADDIIVGVKGRNANVIIVKKFV